MIEYRQVSEMKGDGDTLHGLVTPFNSWTQIGDSKRGGFKERIAPGTFAKTLQEQDVVLIHSHNTAMPMARTSIPSGPGSLDLREDAAAGLRAKATPTQTSYAKDVLINADAGVIRGMSFGFEVIKDDWTDDEGRAADQYTGTQRTIREVRLHEVTTTAFPAYKDTQLSARDETSALLEQRAAKASYADTATCADCGAKDQYGAYCTGCGGDMNETKSKGKSFCANCGSKMPKRAADHVCDAEQRDTAGDILLDAVAQVITLVNGFPEDQREAKLAEAREALKLEVPEPASATQDEDARADAVQEAAILRAVHGI